MCPLKLDSFGGGLVPVTRLMPVAVERVDFLACLFHLGAQPRERLKIALSALNLFIQNHSIETLAPLDQLLRQFEMSARAKPKPVDELLDHHLCVFDAL